MWVRQVENNSIDRILCVKSIKNDESNARLNFLKMQIHRELDFVLASSRVPKKSLFVIITDNFNN